MTDNLYADELIMKIQIRCSSGLNVYIYKYIYVCVFFLMISLYQRIVIKMFAI